MMWIDSKNCSGCGACYQICAHNAIQMVEAKDGFKYPKICAERCTNCGRCKRVCRERQQEMRNYSISAYAAVGRNEDLVKRSASGGVFATLAQSFVQNGGRVAGAVMELRNNSLHVCHKLSAETDDISAMQGSKYVQSDAWECYAEVITAVGHGERVLFAGTPCQVSAIKRLTGDPENLFTIDLICHGVPSMRMFNEFADILGRRFGGKLEEMRFRDKSCGKNFCAQLTISRQNRKQMVYLDSGLLSFYKLFLDVMIFRESCYDCRYASLERVADVTIGDYWGIEEKHAAEFDSGVMEKRSDWSGVLVNTEKGRRLIEKAGAELKLYETQEKWIAEKNAQLIHPSCKPMERDRLMNIYMQGGYRALERLFIKTHGSRVRYYWRVVKNIRANKERCTQNKEMRQ